MMTMKTPDGDSNYWMLWRLVGELQLADLAARDEPIGHMAEALRYLRIVARLREMPSANQGVLDNLEDSAVQSLIALGVMPGDD